MRKSTEAVSALYAEYAREAAAEVGHLILLLGRLEREPADRDVLEQLMHRFHSIAGSGGTFGVPALSAIGSEAEGLAMRALAAAAPLTAADRQHLAALATAIAAQLAEQPPAEEVACRAPSVAAAPPAAGLSVLLAAAGRLRGARGGWRGRGATRDRNRAAGRGGRRRRAARGLRVPPRRSGAAAAP